MHLHLGLDSLFKENAEGALVAVGRDIDRSERASTLYLPLSLLLLHPEKMGTVQLDLLTYLGFCSSPT